MARLMKYLFLLLVLMTAPSAYAQDNPKEEGQGDNTKYVKVDKENPDAVVLERPDRFSDPVTGLDYHDEVEVLDEEERGGYIKVRVMVNGKWKEGWVKESILSDEKEKKVDSEAAEAEGSSSSAQGVKGSIGMEPIDTEGINARAPLSEPWNYIDPVGASAKIVSSPLPYHLIIPGALIVGGGALAAILAITSDDPEPVVPDQNPEGENPEFSLLNDEYELPCGQELNIFPLQNDEGTGLIILEINNAPEGVQLLNDSSIFVSSVLNSDVSFTLDIQDAVGQVGSTVVTISIVGFDVVANDESFELTSGETISGNLLQNDLCLGCSVIDVSEEDESLTFEENGDFEYTSPEDFAGEASYTVTIENPCGSQDSSVLTFIVNPEPPCNFDWEGSVEVVPADCGLSNGAAFATEELFGPYNFSWSNGVDVPENEDVSPGSYELVVTDTTFGCTDTLTAEVGESPADYEAEASVLGGGCGETDNIQLTSNASVENPLIVSLSGSTDGVIDNITEPTILIGNWVELNPGSLTITIWSEQQGADCTQVLEVVLGEGPPIPEVLVAEVVQPEPPENVGTIVLDLFNTALPADVIVNGELYTTAMAPQVILDGLPPGFYTITVVDFEGCESIPVEVVLESQGINPNPTFLRWSPSMVGIANWIHTPSSILLQTREGQDFYTLASNPIAVPISAELSSGNWLLSAVFSQATYRGQENGRPAISPVQYFEMAVGHGLTLREARVSLKLGYSEWRSKPSELSNVGIRAGFIEGAINWPLESLPGQIQLGFRAGMLSNPGRAVAIPSVQWTFGP